MNHSLAGAMANDWKVSESLAVFCCSRW